MEPAQTLKENYILSADVGGSHITAALIGEENGFLAEGTMVRKTIDNRAAKDVILAQWTKALREAASPVPKNSLSGITLAMPGPFNYTGGICLMKGVNKYDSLYGVNISSHIRQQLKLSNDFPVVFENDASCFGLGESLSPGNSHFNSLIAITIGTGFGTTFLHNKKIQREGKGIPPSGHLYNYPYLDGIAEDFISGAWILKTYNDVSVNNYVEVRDVAENAIHYNDQKALEVFGEFGNHLSACLMPWIKSFGAECVVIGGSISKSSGLFIAPLQQAISRAGLNVSIKTSTDMELSALTGAASLIRM